jgi:hypothetical protein
MAPFNHMAFQKALNAIDCDKRLAIEAYDVDFARADQRKCLATFNADKAAKFDNGYR